MAEIITSTGFICDIDESCLDDMEMLEDVVALDKGDGLVLPGLIRKLLGEKGKQELYDHVRTVEGRVPMIACAAEISDIFNELKEAKK
ncbi:MAG: hypothetical protein SPE18_12120 [Candidatus Limivicinus sp.]|nr:hypothetical protein [Candidatus Limivicinus sp.]